MDAGSGTSSDSLMKKAKEAADFLFQCLPHDFYPRVGLICGSGLGGLADTLHSSPRAEVDYAEIPHFPISTGMNPSVPVAVQARVLLIAW